MNLQNDASARQPARPDPASAPPLWWIIAKQELIDLWIGGRVLILLILFSILMSTAAVLQNTESQISAIPAAEMVYLTLLGSVSFGVLISLILGADSISGERERATFEALLLTPASRRQIVLGKFIAALSPWPAALILSIPYMAAVARGDAVFGQAVVIGTLLGTVLAAAFTGFGMLVSIWSKSNKKSLLACLLIYVILLIPTQFPGGAHKGDLGYFIQQLNPLQATSAFIEKLLVNNRTLAEQSGYLVATLLSAAVILVVLFAYAAPRMRLDGGVPRPFWKGARRAAASVLVAAAASFLTPAPAPAQDWIPGQALEIGIDLTYKTVNAGDEVKFTTTVVNTGTRPSAPLNVAMNIIKTQIGDPVDPEDWSPERTQALDPLAPGESVEQSWTVEAILEGDYLVYLTVVPTPDGPEATSLPVSSPGLHLTVMPFTSSNPAGVLPVAIGVPVALILLALLSRRSRRWRRGNDAAGAGVAR
ncbi:ABC transporter permease subunit [Defluviimonas sp. WL0024]|uniref:ABC transporter permease subunit n=1 Tax=Albidovulum salinarum TaxID=2984153 RepID=A0ABT2X1X6_9RHOB|nr:ABC transporter permease subunit [Defluviimonas sp. WL0024]MCU9847953.1 ABC transporter permease subunit [Defluviimonas sp. WL0024]